MIIGIQRRTCGRPFRTWASILFAWCLFNFAGSIILIRQNQDSPGIDYKDLLEHCGHVEYLIFIIHVFWFISLCFWLGLRCCYGYMQRCIPILAVEMVIFGLLSFIWTLVLLWMWWWGKTWTETHMEKNRPITTTTLCWERIRDDAFSVFFLIIFNALQYGICLVVLTIMRIYNCLHFLFPYDQLQQHV